MGTFLAAICFISLLNAAPSLLPKEQTQLEKKNWITQVKKIKNEVWPEITIKTYIKASPVQAAAIFSAFELQTQYIPNLVKADIVKRPKPSEVHVSYELSMPWPIKKGTYTNGHYLLSPEKNHYQIKWFSIKSDIAKELKGHIYFMPHQGKTLLVYQTFVRPDSFFAGILRKLMVKDVEESLVKTIEFIEKSVKNKEFTEAQTALLLLALNKS